MDRIGAVRMIIVLGFGLSAGCGKAPSSPPPTKPSAQASSSNNPETNAISAAATDFLDAVLDGDIQRASTRLTPQAMQRIIGSGIQFRPPGQEKASFRTGEVRMPTKTQALVQFVFTYTAADGSANSEEGCCLMRLIENEWRVSGLAYGTGENQRWTLSNFETGQTIPIARQPTVQNGAGQPASDPASRPSPPRTAQESAPAVR